jgi:hypothetical protein
MPKYDHPNHVVIRDKHVTGALSVATAVDSAYVGTTLRSRNKAVIVGVAFRVGSGGSAAGSNSFKLSRINAAGTVSTWQVLTQLVSAGASAAGETYDISLVSGLTVHSLGEGAVLIGQAASLDKIPVLSDVVWRYRILPGGDDEVTHITAG